jgi:lysozyme
VQVTKNQYLAMLSLMWNIGPGNFKASTLLKLVNANDSAGAALQFERWNKANGQVMNGLTNRRLAEKALFLKA